MFDTSELFQFLMDYSIHVNSRGSVWISWDPHGSAWIPMDPQEFYVDPRGYRRNLRLLKTSNQVS